MLETLLGEDDARLRRVEEAAADLGRKSRHKFAELVAVQYAPETSCTMLAISEGFTSSQAIFDHGSGASPDIS